MTVAWAPLPELLSWLAAGWNICVGAHATPDQHASYGVLVWREEP